MSTTRSQSEFLALRTKAIESLMVEKGLVTADVIDDVVRVYEQEIGPLRGASIVARTWADPEYKRRLLEDGTAAMKELGIQGFAASIMVVLENTPKVHNLVVCTLCSCYPWAVLGLPPRWYKSPAYRGRVVRDPRGVLREFGIELADDVEVRVWDSSSEVRYLVLPERPEGTEDLSEEQLAALVSRNAMIGTAFADRPAS
ncbi:Low-molecular weight cobalt-containing nitrile hydratase subunit alpha [Baekduia alba]|uniref:nitrile hydratase subunit alpha n=1 Tax=Baekduia alba TaxID=2997333 RepID=UPI002340CB06|nr:nitrile hydratase subunit alpha [Baekduia alba]WCB94924.1 Low-molecular weight cobalt-containing nitrile hydratase subunit alpha [Baekduia alba]